MGIFKPCRFLIPLAIFVLCSTIDAAAQDQAPLPGKNAPAKWILDGYSKGVKGIGVATYSSFNPEKAWREALKNAVNDLNANHSMIVHSYGKQVGRGPLRLESKYAIRSFVDTTQVAVVDSAQWKGRAFVLVEPSNPVPDSTIYPQGNFRTVEKPTIDSSGVSQKGKRWLHSTGSTPRIDSNWYMSITKAKQDALRRLAEHLATEVSTETYTKNATSRRYYSFSSMFAFQRIRITERIFTSDTVKVKVAVKPSEVKMLME